jgi:transaldolase
MDEIRANEIKDADGAKPAAAFDAAVIECGRSDAEPKPHALVSSPLLAALRRAGTSHVYADTADVEELRQLVATRGGVLAEVDGNTANQPLVRKVMARYLDGRLRMCAGALAERPEELPKGMLRPLLYAIVCGRIGNDVVSELASGRAWEVSLQLHMRVCDDAGAAQRIGRDLRRMVPSAFVKVPFTPHLPHCFIVARDLEREGIPVNFTSTFSARQVVVAALLADVTRTNIFMGRLDQGLEAELLGAHVSLEAQRALRRLRADHGVKTELIVASMRAWRTFVDTAGCDVFTAPCTVLRAFLDQSEVTPAQIKSRLETSYQDRLGISARVQRAVGAERIAGLYQVEPELIKFLREFRSTDEWRAMLDGDALYRRFEGAGFASLFYAPSEREWQDLRQSKLPDLDSPLTTSLPLDTLYSLLADGDFENHQEAIDREIEGHLARHAAEQREGSE